MWYTRLQGLDRVILQWVCPASGWGYVVELERVQLYWLLRRGLVGKLLSRGMVGRLNWSRWS